MFRDPLANRPPTALPTDQGGGNQRENEGPGVAFAPRFAGVRNINDRVHQGAILRLVHPVPSSLCSSASDCTGWTPLFYEDFDTALGVEALGWRRDGGPGGE